MRDFEYNRALWAVVNPDGTFAGVPCLSWEEARELRNAAEGRWIYVMYSDPDGDAVWEDDRTLEDDALDFDEFYNPNLDMGFDPYLGCYTDDC